MSGKPFFKKNLKGLLKLLVKEVVEEALSVLKL